MLFNRKMRQFNWNPAVEKTWAVLTLDKVCADNHHLSFFHSAVESLTDRNRTKNLMAIGEITNTSVIEWPSFCARSRLSRCWVKFCALDLDADGLEYKSSNDFVAQKLASTSGNVHRGPWMFFPLLSIWKLSRLEVWRVKILTAGKHYSFLLLKPDGREAVKCLLLERRIACRWRKKASDTHECSMLTIRSKVGKTIDCNIGLNTHSEYIAMKMKSDSKNETNFHLFPSSW